MINKFEIIEFKFLFFSCHSKTRFCLRDIKKKEKKESVFEKQQI